PLFDEARERSIAAGGGQVSDSAGRKQVGQTRSGFVTWPVQAKRIERRCLTSQQSQPDLPPATLIPPAGNPGCVAFVEPAGHGPPDMGIQRDVRKLVTERDDRVGERVAAAKRRKDDQPLRWNR